jgi:shikimate kinase
VEPALKDLVLLYLVGFMGAGKTTVGRRLSELLGWGFVDLDERIESRTGETVREIFRNEGEAHFRRLEHEELRRLSTLNQMVVALGGGAFCTPENERVVRATGASIFLDAPADLLYGRCAGDGSRPLFSTREAMDALLERRRPLYERANLRIEVAGLDVDAVARRIVAALHPQ